MLMTLPLDRQSSVFAVQMDRSSCPAMVKNRLFPVESMQYAGPTRLDPIGPDWPNYPGLLSCAAVTATINLQGCQLKITVVICTYRRPDSLARTLASIAEAERPLTAEWQLLVVDNSDCADTQRVANSFSDRLPIEVLIEPEAGLSHARNAAVRHADCDYVIWTDDDVAVSSQWLSNYEAAFAAHPDAAFFGGPIAPQFEGRPPAWLNAALPLIGSAFAACDLADKAENGLLKPGALPFGANVAIRAREQLALQYDVSRGRQPGRWLLSGEESQLLRMISRAGGIGVWVHDASVTHWIDAERQSIAYLRRYYEGRAIAEARATLAQPAMQGRGTVLLWRDLLGSELTWLRGWLLRDPGLWVNALKRASRLRGTLAARREIRREDEIGLGAEG
jgi:glycosyltransferase involved in cell wall biosynthesis